MNETPPFHSELIPESAAALIDMYITGDGPYPILTNDSTGKRARITYATYRQENGTLTLHTRRGTFSIHAPNWVFMQPVLNQDLICIIPRHGTAKYTINLY